MRIQLDCRLVGELIEERGGVSVFLDQWDSRSSDAHERLSRATVYRWMNGESVPKNRELFLRLAGALDVDSFALVTVLEGDILAAADEVLRIVQNSYGAPSWLQFVHGFFGRHIAWPPEELAAVYFGRPWYVQEFSHDPDIRANYYATVLLCHALKPPDRRPQVLHFAYKHPSLFHARWLQYGLVRVCGASGALHHISGYTAQLELTAPDEPIRVETWFGPGAALFRIASLHPFSHELVAPGGTVGDALRFPG